MRIEHDMLGTKPVEDAALYGVHTTRALENFALGYRPTQLPLIYALVTVKKAAALTYVKLDKPRAKVYEAIADACDAVLAGEADSQFPVDALQGGAGTSTNMNVNEVLANLALEKLGHARGDYAVVHPLDDVNRGQSTNDVYPTALRIAAIRQLRALGSVCAALQTTLDARAQEFADIPKLGRTELMDAVPITLGAEFAVYAQAIGRDVTRLAQAEAHLKTINLGGTAVGTADTADSRYRHDVIGILCRLTGIDLMAADHPMDITQNNDILAEVSGQLKALAVTLMKMATDLRLMNSGPHGGFGEIRLAAMQAGSSIMPGKVNPVMPEMVTQVAIKVMGNDFVIATAAARGEFELNAFGPLMADALLESLTLLTNAVSLMQNKCIALLTPDRKRCAQLLEESFAFAASYIPVLGYDAVSNAIGELKGDTAAIRQRLEDMLGLHASARQAGM